MVVIASHGSWQPGRGPVTTWTASSASREIMALAEQDPMPASLQQEQHLRTAYDAKATGRTVPRLIMASWDVDGWCDIAAMTDAINTHIRRHDTYHSAFDVTADTITRRTVDEADRIEFVPTALGFMDQGAIRTLVQTATPSTLEWDCFTFGVIQKADHFTVYANIDHLHTDGTSAGLIYRDIHQTYQGLVEGRPTSLPETSRYRDFTARQRLQVEAMTLDSRSIKDWVDFARDTEGDWPSFPLELGDMPSSGAGGIVTIELLDADETDVFNAACRDAGARFSGGVMACAALADHRLTGTETFHGFTPSDTRSGDAQSLSAGWYASLFPVSVPVGDGDFAQMARAAQKSFDANKHLSAVPFKRVLDLASADELGVTPASKPSMMVSLMDFRALADADANRLGIYLDNLSHGGINTWIIRHADQTTLTISFPETPEARHSAHHYAGVLRAAFTGVTDFTEDWVDAAADQPFAHSA
ncbi:condensation domain-containing protein [Mycolicibacterium sp.]|uniref:condensation domain-containing protein n=1 Tax=Mycolicibacterium sp. TaxID=2320850 RepID=UPI001A30F732|nr:condensation domain-containing protein [Mycolicibacterium sp.]MBJ7399920.1 acyltransferase [Mycolicibacterium sp.]